MKDGENSGEKKGFTYRGNGDSESEFLFRQLSGGQVGLFVQVQDGPGSVDVDSPCVCEDQAVFGPGKQRGKAFFFFQPGKLKAEGWLGDKMFVCWPG